MLHDSISGSGGAALAGGRLKRLIVAVDIFGFHLAPIDLRQNSDVHERRSPSFWRWPGAAPTISLWGKTNASPCCRTNCPARARFIRPHLKYSEESAKELAIFFTAQDLKQKYGDAALPNAIISKAAGVSDMLELALLMKEAGLLSPGVEPKGR